MDIKIRIVLIIATISCFLFLVRNARKGKLRTDYLIGWIVASIGLIIISIFPQIVFGISHLVGVVSPVNVVFLFIIFILIVQVFLLFNKVSTLEEKLKNVIQEMSIDNLKNDYDLKEKSKSEKKDFANNIGSDDLH